MKFLRKLTTCTVGGFIGLMFSAAALASGNGGGNEPPNSNKDSEGGTADICTILPLLCVVTTESGNGGGNEPPQ